jgi:shikimate kinase
MGRDGETSVAEARADLIFLIGPRGSGKTTAATALAAHLGWSCVDADEELERAAGLAIREVFAAEGEAGFREREAGILKAIGERSACVVATGGGVVLREDNRELLRRGWVVWLTADADSLWQRLQGDDSTLHRRPSLTALPPREEIAEVLRIREPLYAACADQRIETAGKSVAEIVAEIIAFLESATATPEGEHPPC